MDSFKNILLSGTPILQAKRALIMLHGRGSRAEDISSLAKYLKLENTAIFAPQANNNTWYPHSFMAPDESNQPALDQSIDLIADLVKSIEAYGFSGKQIYFLGFSQGACLSLEYVTRNAGEYGGVIAFTGGLIGEKLHPEKYKGDFNHTQVLITTGDPDPHVPLKRVEESVAILKSMKADVQLRVYKDRRHTILHEEIDLAAELMMSNKQII